ncbi:hypothetical protein ISF_04520 [Cordyceps fumosorosea ARSEF 2679]|uniref:Uncharacterized protein n=1 Tax=Cordyceps fumosorosea (strain ARSEF 2679) TaxID=1081104 RepID=A0A167WHW6_CORFA|nr:hypothetical protein ISF_04520 [Cordyceps fumosorosea ARSEF 2679]OAA63811.1 hypothetical protein ISF_04520 [Cordyceps fumosorosea ARSEF 2679]
MLRYTTLAITAALATTCTTYAAATAPEGDTTGTGIFFYIPNQGVPGSATLLTARQQGGSTGGPDICTGGQVACDSSCIDAGFECCHVGQGQACQEGYSCYSQGCCRHGKTCSGPPRGCTSTTKVCDVGCIPRDRVCCGLGDGSSCDPGTVCLASGLCGTPASSGSASSSVGGQDQTPTSTASSSGVSSTSRRTLPASAIGESVTLSAEASSSARTTAAAGSPGGPSSVGASASDKSKPTTESSASSDKGAAGATLEAPAVLAGLLALAAYFI